jgi:hypothetical protein
VADLIKCVCTACGAKYRLPVEFGGRTARCKKCDAKFEVPKEKGLEDSVLDWLSEAEGTEEEVVEKPRVISMPKSQTPDDSDAGRKPHGVIRLKTGSTAPPRPH